MVKRIVMLCGVPAAGKSTWLEKEFQGEAFILSTDNTIQDMAEFEGKTYDDVFKKYIKVAERMMWEDFDKLVEHNFNPIVIDRTNVSRSARKKFFERLKNFHKHHTYQIEAVVFSTPEKTEWVRRLNNRPGKTIPQHVLESMNSNFECPSQEEGFVSVTIVS